MAIFRCKMCGADLSVGEGTTVVQCDSCGTNQTVPAVRGVKKITAMATPQPVPQPTSQPAPQSVPQAAPANSGNTTQLILEDDTMYEGNWHRGKRHGQGKVIWNAGGEWVGTSKNGKPWNGKGVWYDGGEKHKGRHVFGTWINSLL